MNKEAYTPEEVVRITEIFRSLRVYMRTIQEYRSAGIEREFKDKAIRANQEYIRNIYAGLPQNIRKAAKGLEQEVQELLAIPSGTSGY